MTESAVQEVVGNRNFALSGDTLRDYGATVANVMQQHGLPPPSLPSRDSSTFYLVNDPDHPGRAVLKPFSQRAASPNMLTWHDVRVSFTETLADDDIRELAAAELEAVTGTKPDLESSVVLNFRCFRQGPDALKIDKTKLALVVWSGGVVSFRSGPVACMDREVLPGQGNGGKTSRLPCSDPVALTRYFLEKISFANEAVLTNLERELQHLYSRHECAEGIGDDVRRQLPPFFHTASYIANKLSQLTTGVQRLKMALGTDSSAVGTKSDDILRRTSDLSDVLGAIEVLQGRATMLKESTSNLQASLRDRDRQVEEARLRAQTEYQQKIAMTADTLSIGVALVTPLAIGVALGQIITNIEDWRVLTCVVLGSITSGLMVKFRHLSLPELMWKIGLGKKPENPQVGPGSAAVGAVLQRPH